MKKKSQTQKCGERIIILEKGKPNSKGHKPKGKTQFDMFKGQCVEQTVGPNSSNSYY